MVAVTIDGVPDKSAADVDRLTRDLTSASIHINTGKERVDLIIRGNIARKRKYRDNVSLAIRKLLPNGLAFDENGKEPAKEPPVLVMVPKSDPSMPLEACFVGAIVEIHLQSTIRVPKPEKSDDQQEFDKRKEHSHHTAQSLKIIRCSPDPNAIQDCLKQVLEGKLPLDVFSSPASNGENSKLLLKDMDQAKKILSLGPKDAFRRAFVKCIAACLTGEADSIEALLDDAKITIRRRKRQSHIKARQREVLEKLEASQVPMQPTFVQSDETTDNGSSTILPLDTTTNGSLTYNLPDPNDATMMSGRHPKTRREYLHDKKWPQIRWLVKRLAPVLDHVQTQKTKQQSALGDTEYIEVLDVGGGRGDLAVAVAEAFPNVRVTVVDLNESSLEGGRAYYQSRKPSDEINDRVLFVCGDFAEYAKTGGENGTPKHFDVVTAWHACGDLSDYALEFAVKECEANASAFVICPCCYTKRYIESFEPKWIGDYYDQQQQCIPCSTTPEQAKDTSSNEIRTIQKLAEINERPDITHRSMGLINTMRLRSLLALLTQNNTQQDQPTFDICLEEYDLSFSSKNLVLVGVKN